MTKQHALLAIPLAGVFSLFVANLALAAGVMGFQMGDRSLEENSSWLKKGVEHIQMAIKEAKAGNGEKSAEHGEAGLAAMNEINSESWAAKLEQGGTSIRYGIKAAKKGKLEKASLEYQEGLKKLGTLKIGTMNWTHESFLGIGDRR